MRVILVGGLPGSGKSYHLKGLEDQGCKVFDDFQARAANDSDQFEHSRRFQELVGDLRTGRTCVVADIRVIHKPYRASAQAALARNLGAVELECHLFENDPRRCAENVQRSQERDPTSRLREIRHWTNHYSRPPGARVLPVWRPESTKKNVTP